MAGTNELNPRQLEAVNHTDGPILIAAGAGSGKTKTLTNRLAHFIKNGINPQNIIAITFTNKAAREMLSRVEQLKSYASATVDQFSKNSSTHQLINSSTPFIGTFHSLGARILKNEAKLLKRTPSFTIFDNDDSLSLIRKTMTAANVSKEQYGAANIESKISSVKNELLDPEEYLDGVALMLFRKYEAALIKNNAFDFDDLIEKVVRLFQDHPKVLEKYQNQFQYILVDEYQDVNTSQYYFVKLLAEKHHNLSVVGDDAQCVTPDTKIITNKGLKIIKDVSLKDKIIAASGNGEICEAKISKIKKFKYSGPLVKITTNGKKVLRLTPNHLIFIKPRLIGNIYYVYLMYRKDKGFRIGITKGTRISRRGEQQLGLIVRNNQEKADKVWIIKVCSDRADAEYYEYYYAFRYGIPTVVFDTANRNMQLTQSHVNQLFNSIDSRKNAQQLMADELLYFSYPHWLPKGTVRHSSRRLRVRLTLFDDRRKSLVNPWGMSRISVNTKDSQLKNKIESLGFRTRRGKLSDWRLEIARLNYGEIEQIAERLKNIDSEIEIVRSACLTKNKRFYFQPASHARPTMEIAVKIGSKIVSEVIESVEVEQYEGFVFDLDVKNVHNYTANKFVVHNSIYGFRGSDFRNFLNFDRDWPNAKIVKLEQNYRSTANIIAAASALIKNNKFQKPKDLWTENEPGSPIQVVGCVDTEQEAAWVAKQIESGIRNHELGKMKRANSLIHNSSFIIPSTAVLYRTNAQSRSIEQELIAQNIPYRIFGGLRFYDRKEIKDIVAALRIAANPKDEISAERIAKNFNKSVAATLLSELPRLGKELKILELINFFLNNADYFNYLDKNFKNPRERMENINELIAFAAEFQELPEFLERISLLQSTDKPAKNSSTHQLINSQTVQLMTVHLAKGLEFENVFVIGCNEGLLPHQMSYGSLDELEEERRLMYVAMTRAKKELCLSFYHTPSRFIYEIPPELTEFIDLGGSKKQLPNEEDIYIEDW